MRDTPEIRFKGFTGAWVQRKLGEVAEFSKGNGYSKSDLTDMGTPIILYGRLYTNYETIIEDVDTFVNIKGKPTISCGGEVIIPSSGETAGDISRASVVSKSGVILGGDLNIVTPDSTINSTFLALTISSGNSQRELSKRAQGKSVVHINNSDLKEVSFKLTTFLEQTAIGNFFHTLDKTVTLLKRKLDGLKQLKKAYLQQMFPQAGERVPKVRFAGFTGDWEVRKLGEVIEKLKSYSLSREAETNEVTGYRYIHYGDIHKQVADIVVADEQLPHIKGGNYIPIEKGDLVLADASEDYVGIAEPCIILHTPKDKIIAGLHTIAIRPVKSNPLYLYFLFHTDEFRKFGKYVGTGLKVFGITYNNLAQYAMVLPSFEEQTAIGNFFRNLDEQITAQQIKLDNLKQLKSAYLQKMFV